LVRKGGLEGRTLEETGEQISSMIEEVLLRGNEVFAEMLIQPRTQDLPGACYAHKKRYQG